MKLIFCNKCRDLFRLNYSTRTCECGESKGAYEADGLHAWISGPATPIGIANPTFLRALENRPLTGMGERFEAFVVPVNCDTVKVEK